MLCLILIFSNQKNQQNELQTIYSTDWLLQSICETTTKKWLKKEIIMIARYFPWHAKWLCTMDVFFSFNELTKFHRKTKKSAANWQKLPTNAATYSTYICTHYMRQIWHIFTCWIVWMCCFFLILSDQKCSGLMSSVFIVKICAWRIGCLESLVFDRKKNTQR